MKVTVGRLIEAIKEIGIHKHMPNGVEHSPTSERIIGGHYPNLNGGHSPTKSDKLYGHTGPFATVDKVPIKAATMFGINVLVLAEAGTAVVDKIIIARNDAARVKANNAYAFYEHTSEGTAGE